MEIIIYKYENKVNHKIYIGQTRQTLIERARKNGEGYKRCQLFWRAIQKYGWDNFIPSILEKVSTYEEANLREQYWIKYYDSTNPKNGYNLYSGGLNHQATDIAKKHMSEAQRNKPPISEKTRNKMSIAHKGKNAGEKHYCYGKELSQKTKNKISVKLSDGLNPASKKVQCLETGEIFETVSLASMWCNNGKTTLRSHIAQQIQGKRKSCGKHPITKEPLHWRYIE